MATQQPQATRVAAIYARVSSERQRQDQTIDSQLAALRELSLQRDLLVPEQFVFCDEGISGGNLVRPALELLRDRASESAFEVLLCHSPDRLSRRYAYQVLLLEELQRAGVEVVFVHDDERSGTPEGELLRQFQGMIAEYERAQIAERTRRGKLHRARQGSPAVLGSAPYGYNYIKKTDHADARYEIDAMRAEVVHKIFDLYTEENYSIGKIMRTLAEAGIPSSTGKAVWDRSVIWAMLRNPAYQGQAAFGRNRTTPPSSRPTRAKRRRGERIGRAPSTVERAPEEWTLIDVPAIITSEQFQLAGARLAENKRYSPRNTKYPTLLQGLVVCGRCGYACCRTTHRRQQGPTHYYHCIASKGLPGRGRLCTARRIRVEELDELVWEQVTRVIQEPTLARAELDRRRQAALRAHPAKQRQRALERDLTRARTATARLIEAYQEELIRLDELRQRIPDLRKHEQTIDAQLAALQAEQVDNQTYLTLAEQLESFLTRLDSNLEKLTLAERQRLVRLIVHEVVLHPDEDKITIKHSIPAPKHSSDENNHLRWASQDQADRLSHRRPQQGRT